MLISRKHIKKKAENENPYATPVSNEDRSSWGEFSGGPWVDGGVSVGPDGLLIGAQKRVSKEDVTVPAKYGAYGIIPIRYIKAADETNPEKHKAWVVFKFLDTQGEEKETTIPAGEISSNIGIKILRKNNYQLPSHTKRNMLLEGIQKILKCQLKENRIEQICGTCQLGWHEESGRHIRPGDSCYAGMHPSMRSIKGDPEVWKDLITKIIVENPVVGLVHATAIAGYLRGIIQLDHSYFLSLFGQTSQGKTFALQTAASWQTQPGKGEISLIYPGDSSKVGLEIVLESNRHGFVGIDEISPMLSTYNAMTVLMGLSNNGNRVKAQRNGDISANVRKWNCSIIITGNTPISGYFTGDDQEQALEARMIEIDTSTNDYKLWSFNDAARVKEILKILRENHGFGYDLVIEYIKENRSILQEYFHEFQEFIAKKINSETNLFGQHFRLTRTGSGIVSRQAEHIGLMYCGLQMLEDILDVDLTEHRELLFYVWNDVWKRYENGEIQQLREELLKWMSSNISHIKIDNFYYSETRETEDIEKAQEKSAKIHNENNQKQEKWGVLKSARIMLTEDDWNGTLYVYDSAIKSLKAFGINIIDAVRQADEEGWRKVVPSKKTRPKQPIGFNQGSAYGGFILDVSEAPL